MKYVPENNSLPENFGNRYTVSIQFGARDGARIISHDFCICAIDFVNAIAVAYAFAHDNEAKYGHLCGLSIKSAVAYVDPAIDDPYLTEKDFPEAFPELFESDMPEEE